MAKKSKGNGKAVPANWDLVVSSLTKKLGGSQALFRLDDMPQALDVEVIPTGIAGLDNALGVFGFPKGRIIEVYGPESSGKTSLALMTIAQAQKLYPDRPVLYVDLEHALEPVWMATLGVQSNTLWIAQPNCAEDALQVVLTAAETGEPVLIVLDSVASLSPLAEIEGEMSDQQMGQVGRLMGKFCRKIIPALKKNGTTLMCINQIRAKLGPYGGEARPGGNALKFFASQIIRIRKSGDLAKGGEIIGIDVTCEIKKNKVAPPFRSAIISLLFESGFSPTLSLVDCAAEEEIIKKSGAWYSYKDENIGQGRLNTAAYLEGHPEVRNEVYEAYKAAKLQVPLTSPASIPAPESLDEEEFFDA